jgi:hypothetical protein
LYDPPLRCAGPALNFGKAFFADGAITIQPAAANETDCEAEKAGEDPDTGLHPCLCLINLVPVMTNIQEAHL